MTTVAIIHGFAEGPAISKKLRQLLREQGYRITNDYQQADVIIAHSGGLFLLPSDLPDKHLILSAPAVGERRHSIPVTTLQKVWLDAKAARHHQAVGRWLIKSGWNAVYIFGRLPTTRQMWRGAKRHAGRLPAFTARRVVVLSHQDDPWSEHISKDDINKHSYSFVSHTGTHDDIWINPEKYITVIQYIYES